MTFQKGDKIQCVNIGPYYVRSNITIGHVYEIQETYDSRVILTADDIGEVDVYEQSDFELVEEEDNIDWSFER